MGLPEESTPTILYNTHRKQPSELGDLTFLELQLPPDNEEGKATMHEFVVDETKPKLPESHLVLITGSDTLHGNHTLTGSQEVLNSFNDLDMPEVHGNLKVIDWKGKKFYSDYIAEGLDYLNQEKQVIMLFETPSSSSSESSFHNRSSFRFHDWPPTKECRAKAKSVLGPCRYAMMNGSALPTFLRNAPPQFLTDHWKEAIPGFKECTFVSKIDTDRDTVYAYIPVEDIPKHVNDPYVHYHLAGKDAIHLMTQKTTKLLPDTKTVRPCVVKTTHSQGSKGIFVIQDDEDEAEFEAFLRESGNPTFVVTQFVDIQRNVACHFFMHPDGESVTWLGSNENKKGADGKFMMFDSVLCMDDQEELKRLQLPFVEEVVNYCHALNFWGFIGVDVLFDSNGDGFLVDINPRVTGSCPALMALSQLKRKFAFNNGLFRRNGDIFYRGNPTQLFDSVERHNKENEGKSRIVIHSYFESNEYEGITEINIGVYGTDLEECRTILNSYAKAVPLVEN